MKVSRTRLFRYLESDGVCFLMLLLLCLSILWFLTIATLLAHAIRQYGYFQVLRADASTMVHDAPEVLVVLPARDEEANLPRCLNGLLSQDYPAARWRVRIVDDNSSDRTAAVAREFAERDARVSVMSAGALPVGWAGKAHACWQGAQEAGAARWICFIDADTAPHPPLLRTAVAEATRRGVGLLSLSPFQELGGFWERLIMPAAFFLIAFTQDLRQTNDPASPDAQANGQFLLFDRGVYDAIGGFAAARESVGEDSAMARAVKHAGHTIAMLGTEGLIRTRMYVRFRPLWQGLGRQAGELLGSTAACLFWSAGALLIAWASVLLPVWAALAIAHSGATALGLASVVLSGVASLALLGTYMGTARYFHIPMAYGLLLPASYTMGAAILLNAARGRAAGQIAWKGRAYGPRKPNSGFPKSE